MTLYPGNQVGPPMLRTGVPDVQNFRVHGRDCGAFGTSHYHGFLPPRSIQEWPQTVGEIGDNQMRKFHCSQCGSGAKGRTHLHYLLCG